MQMFGLAAKVEVAKELVVSSNPTTKYFLKTNLPSRCHVSDVDSLKLPCHFADIMMMSSIFVFFFQIQMGITFPVGKLSSSSLK